MPWNGLLERQVAFVVDEGEVIAFSVRVGLLRYSRWRSAVGAYGWFATILTFRASEVYITGNDFDGGSIVSVFILILPGLKTAINSDERTFLEILADELGGTVPSNDINPIRLTLPVGIFATTVTSDAEGCDILASGSLAEFRIAAEPAHDSYYVEHLLSLFLIFNFDNRSIGFNDGSVELGPVVRLFFEAVQFNFKNTNQCRSRHIMVGGVDGTDAIAAIFNREFKKSHFFPFLQEVSLG